VNASISGGPQTALALTMEHLVRRATTSADDFDVRAI
jgi:hypothetical protein